MVETKRFVSPMQIVVQGYAVALMDYVLKIVLYLQKCARPLRIVFLEVVA